MRMFIESDFAGAGRAMRLRDDGHRPPVDGRRGFQGSAVLPTKLPTISVPFVPFRAASCRQVSGETS